MKAQILALWRIIFFPRSTLPALPSDRFWPLDFLVSFYFSFARVVRQGQYANLIDRVGSWPAAFAVVLLLGMIVYWFSGALLVVLVRVFGKKISLRRVLNLIGYSQAPRLLLSVPVSIATAVMPDAVRAQMLGDSGLAFSLLAALLGGALLLYSITLFVWGFVLALKSDPATENA